MAFKYVDSLKLVSESSGSVSTLSLGESLVTPVINKMVHHREALNRKPNIKQVLEIIRSGVEIDRELALILAEENIWDLIGLAWQVNQDFGPQDSEAHMCTGSYGLNEKCPQGCSMCSFSDRSVESAMITQPDFKKSPEEFVTEAKRQIAMVRQYNPQAKVAFKVTHIGLGLKGNSKLRDIYVEVLKAVNKVEGIDFVDACLGLLDWESAQTIAPYVYKYNNNLERIQRPGQEWVTSIHTLDDKVETLRLAKQASMGVCSGLLVGAGESVEDKIDILIKLRELVSEGIIDSSPLNAFVPVYPSDMNIINQVPSEDVILALCLARIMLPHHPFFPNAGRYRFGQYLPAMHAIASGYSSHGNYLTKFVEPETDSRIISLLKKEQ